MSECRPGDKVCVTLNFFKHLKFIDYCRRKTYSQLSVDVALIVVNCAHLTHIIKGGNTDNLYYANLCLVSLSIFLEVMIGLVLTLKERYDIDDESQHPFLSHLNDFAVWLIFFSVLVHVFVTVFVEHPHVPLHAKYRNCSGTK